MASSQAPELFAANVDLINRRGCVVIMQRKIDRLSEQHVFCRYGDGPPLPRELIDIKADDQWASSHAVDWTKAVVTMVPLRGLHSPHT